MAGDVLANDKMVDKPGYLVPESTTVRLVGGLPFVSRGGLKLDHALAEFGLAVAGQVAADVGASTGGFTHCLLQRGARRVYAIDVGYGQLDYQLRVDPQVIVMERVNARYLERLAEPAHIVTLDVSFISLEKILPRAIDWVCPGGNIVALAKPQFEVGRGQVSRGGLVKDPLLHADVLARLILWGIERGLHIKGLTPSPILGSEGNKEFFLWWQKP